MKILVISREILMNQGGGEINDMNLSEGLQDLGATVEFLARRPVLRATQAEMTAFPCASVASPYLYGPSNFLPSKLGRFVRHLDGKLFARACASAVRRIAPDVIHATDRPTISDLKPGFSGPLVYNIRGNVSKVYFPALRRCDAFIAWGEASARIVDQFPEIPALRLVPGVKTERFEPGSGEAVRRRHGLEGRTVVLFVGRLMRLKRVDLLLAAFARLARERDDLALLVVGDGPLRQVLERKAEELRLPGRIVFTGRMRQDELPDYYRAADLFVLCSDLENHPIVLLEAMATGLPVVGPRVGSVPDIITHGTNGRVFTPGSEDDLRQQMAEALDMARDPTVADTNRTKVLTGYSWTTRAKAVHDFYSRLLEERNVQPSR